jgi:hypothetical protein
MCDGRSLLERRESSKTQADITKTTTNIHPLLQENPLQRKISEVQPCTATKSALLPRQISALRSLIHPSLFSKGSITLITPSKVPVIRCNGRSFSHC